jgi:site-specific recombinase XerD
MSPKIKRILAERYNLQLVGADAVCDELNGLIEISRKRCGGDRDNIFVLVPMLIEILTESNKISAVTLHNYTTHGFSSILFYFTANSLLKYDRAVIREFLSDMEALFRSGRLGAWMWQDIQDCSEIIRIYHDKNEIKIRQKTERENRELGVSFEELLSSYKNNAADYRALSDSTMRCRLSSIRVFLWSLERCGVNDVSEFTHKAVNDSVTMLSPSYGGGLPGVIYSIRIFLSFLYESGATPIDYTIAMPQMLPQRGKMRFGFTRDETADILSRVDCSAPIGKRNYAIMLIAARTGLRACDIASLKRTEIDWKTREIRIVQQKTGVPLTIPLMPEVGNAIIDYFYNARGENDSAYIFVKRRGSDEPITSKTVSTMTTKYMNRADIDHELPYRGTHSFRRGFGKRLLDASLSADMLMEMLGQVDVNSVKPYSAIDENGLKYCALSLSSIMSEVA